jgi:hypothetical protein
MPRNLVLVSASALTVATAVSMAAPAHADEQVLHHVKYTVSAQIPVAADIYYRDTEPPTWADYSHNPYVFSPKVEADVGPQKPWVLEVQLADPGQWAMVTATSGLGPLEPMFHCELAVDGVLLDSSDGPKGALCSLRQW